VYIIIGDVIKKMAINLKINEGGIAAGSMPIRYSNNSTSYVKKDCVKETDILVQVAKNMKDIGYIICVIVKQPQN
jgi:hypothetical protein